MERFREAVFVVRDGDHGTVGVAFGGGSLSADQRNGVPTWPLLASLPSLWPEWLGDRSFNEVHGVRFAYVAGAMANGIATTDLVETMAAHGMLGFFGAAGLSPERVEAALDRLSSTLGDRKSWGSNLIHSPNEPDLENAIADLYIRRGVKRVSASAYMALTPAIVRYAFHGVRRVQGRVERQNFVFAKISRPEVARRFLSPPPADMLAKLVAGGLLTADEAAIAATLPVAEDIIVEADSGGHTDNQTLTALFPTILGVRDELAATHGYTRPIRIGAAGGLGTPSAVAAAYALGAAFVLTGSVNQGAVESGLCEEGRKLLANASLADVIMAPAADMFELGVKVQVLKRGTMFGPRALKLYELYTGYDSIEAMPDKVRANLEKRVLGRPTDEIWADTAAFFAERDPKELARAERDPKHRMALIFRWYLGLSSRWAIAGDPSRKLDYQIWCGPAMGAFNAWVKGSFLEAPEARTAGQIALNLLEGAAAITRAQQLRSYGVPVPAAAFQFRPRRIALA
jgi:PfaD family protein